MCWKKRLVKERDEVQERLERLSVFIVGFSFAKLDQRTKSLLRIQQGLMEDYLAVLNMRLEFVLGGAAGSAAGVMIGNSLTSGDEKKPEQKE